MQAVFSSAYAPPARLQLYDLPAPLQRPDEIVVKVHAASLDISTSFAVRGAPLPVRFFTGLLRPKFGVPGCDFAGEILSVGSAVRRFQPGDPVFGIGRGTCAEQTTASENSLTHKPAQVSWQQAAATPTSALAALHALRDAAQLKPGQRILINGAAGGIGTFAIQIARRIGAHVTGVCSPANLDFIRSLGADQAIDYTQQDFTRSAIRYDVILDNVENRTLSDCRRVLSPTGILILNSGTGASGHRFFFRLVQPLLLNPFTRQQLRRYLSEPNPQDLQTIQNWLASGTLRPAISRIYPLKETSQAIQHIETGHARGKIVINMDLC